MEDMILEAAGVYFHPREAAAHRDRLNANGGLHDYKVVAITHKHSYTFFFVVEDN